MTKVERLEKRIGYLVGQYESVIADFEAQVEDLNNRLAQSEAKVAAFEARNAEAAGGE